VSNAASPHDVHSSSTRDASGTTGSGRYAFLRHPRWVALAVLAVVMAAVMVGLGFWQLSRYQERTAINERIEAAGQADPLPVENVLSVDGALSEEEAWVRVTATGVYDTSHEILARNRTLNDRVGFEVLTPLVLSDGTALLVDRGWIPATGQSASDLPEIPAAPTGEVTVVGRVHLPESRADQATEQDGYLQVRRIDPRLLAEELPYSVYPGYLLLDSQRPPVSDELQPIPVELADAGQNLSYMVQWWLFATLTLVGFVWLVRREAGRRAETESTHVSEVRHDDEYPHGGPTHGAADSPLDR